jgi:tetratricopeptide (TPR) repeat protein
MHRTVSMLSRLQTLLRYGLLIGLAAALVIGLWRLPGWLPVERARWKLADAANQLDAGQLDRAQQLLEEAKQLAPQLTGDTDFRRVSLPLLLARGDLAAVVELIQSARNLEPTAKLAIALELFSLGVFDDVVELLSDAPEPDEPLGLNWLNLLAYARSLQAAGDLAAARREISLVLDRFPDQPAFLDTEAWILYRSERHLEALERIDQAIAGMEVDDQTSTVQRRRGWLERVETPSPPVEPTPLVDSPAPPPASLQWRQDQRRLDQHPQRSLAVMRYHRLRILQAVGFEQQALADLQWLQQRGFPLDERLY